MALFTIQTFTKSVLSKEFSLNLNLVQQNVLTLTFISCYFLSFSPAQTTRLADFESTIFKALLICLHSWKVSLHTFEAATTTTPSDTSCSYSILVGSTMANLYIPPTIISSTTHYLSSGHENTFINLPIYIFSNLTNSRNIWLCRTGHQILHGNLCPLSYKMSIGWNIFSLLGFLEFKLIEDRKKIHPG